MDIWLCAQYLFRIILLAVTLSLTEDGPWRQRQTPLSIGRDACCACCLTRAWTAAHPSSVCAARPPPASADAPLGPELSPRSGAASAAPSERTGRPGMLC